MADVLEKVKSSLGITGDYQDATLTEYISEVKLYMIDAGVPKSIVESEMSAGVISRGVSDLWNYGSGKLSEYFYQRVSQLLYISDNAELIAFTKGDYGNSYPINVEGIDIDTNDKVIFSFDEFTKEITNVSDNCVVVTFTKSESESFLVGTYKWTLKLVKETSTTTLVNDGILIVR